MYAEITRHVRLTNLPSASGIERVGDYLYVVGDDSPFLYQLDADWNVIRTQLMFGSDAGFAGRIPKAAKPDLEAVTSVTWQGRNKLLIMGSGAQSPERDRGFLVDVSDPEGPWEIQPVSLTPLYESLRARAEVVGSRLLNIEAAASWCDMVVLFQRGNVSGIHSAVYLEAAALLRHWLNGDALPVPRVREFELPRLHGIASGFSGAANTPDRERILFTASVEDTVDEIQDGPTAGSFVGWLPAFDTSNGRAPIRSEALALVRERGWIYPGKIESITLLPSNGGSNVQAVAVIDDDAGGSELLLLELSQNPI